MEDPDRGPVRCFGPAREPALRGRSRCRRGHYTPSETHLAEDRQLCAPRDPGRPLAPGEFESATWAAIRNSHMSQGTA